MHYPCLPKLFDFHTLSQTKLFGNPTLHSGNGKYLYSPYIYDRASPGQWTYTLQNVCAASSFIKRLNHEKLFFRTVSSANKWEITHGSVKEFGKHFERTKGNTLTSQSSVSLFNVTHWNLHITGKWFTDLVIYSFSPKKYLLRKSEYIKENTEGRKWVE